MRYGIVIEKGESKYSAYVPDLLGCVTTGQRVEEIRRNIREAIELRLEGMREDGAAIPEPSAIEDYVDVDAYAARVVFRSMVTVMFNTRTDNPCYSNHER